MLLPGLHIPKSIILKTITYAKFRGWGGGGANREYCGGFESSQQEFSAVSLLKFLLIIRLRGEVGLTPGSNLTPKPRLDDFTDSLMTEEQRQRVSDMHTAIVVINIVENSSPNINSIEGKSIWNSSTTRELYIKITQRHQKKKEKTNESTFWFGENKKVT